MSKDQDGCSTGCNFGCALVIVLLIVLALQGPIMNLIRDAGRAWEHGRNEARQESTREGKDGNHGG